MMTGIGIPSNHSKMPLPISTSFALRVCSSYFLPAISRTASFACPTPLWTRPSAWSACPSASVCVSPRARPAFSLILPVVFFIPPTKRSLSISNSSTWIVEVGTQQFLRWFRRSGGSAENKNAPESRGRFAVEERCRSGGLLGHQLLPWSASHLSRLLGRDLNFARFCLLGHFAGQIDVQHSVHDGRADDLDMVGETKAPLESAPSN